MCTLAIRTSHISKAKKIKKKKKKKTKKKEGQVERKNERDEFTERNQIYFSLWPLHKSASVRTHRPTQKGPYYYCNKRI